MSVPAPSPYPPPSRRPAAVVAAAVILVLMAAGGLAGAVTGLLVLGGTVDRFRVAGLGAGADPSSVEGVVTLIRVAAVFTTVLAVVLAAVVSLLATGVLRGRPGVRLATWVVCGVGLLCGIGTATVLAVQGATAGPGGGDGLTDELVEAAAGAYPSWWAGLSGALSVAQVLGYLVVAMLLALPAANVWFGRRSVAAPSGTRPPEVPYAPPAGPWQPPTAPR